MAESNESDIVIKSGPMTSIDSFVNSSGPGIAKLDAASQHTPTTVTWDLTLVEPYGISTAALTWFAALAHYTCLRSRMITRTKMQYLREVFSFLEAIELLKVTRGSTRFTLTDGETPIGGYPELDINPLTKIIALDPDFTDTADVTNRESLLRWKSPRRLPEGSEFANKFSKLFNEGPKIGIDLSPDGSFVQAIVECVFNAWLWGKSRATVGCQITSGGISVIIADTGVGMRESFTANRSWDEYERPATDEQAILFCSTVNRDPRDSGLRSIIDTITRQYDGWVTIISGRGEIRWTQESWRRALEKEASRTDVLPNIDDVLHNRRTFSRELLYKGYYRHWRHSMPGCCVSFEIPIRRKTRGTRSHY